MKTNAKIDRYAQLATAAFILAREEYLRGEKQMNQEITVEEFNALSPASQPQRSTTAQRAIAFRVMHLGDIKGSTCLDVSFLDSMLLTFANEEIAKQEESVPD